MIKTILIVILVVGLGVSLLLLNDYGEARVEVIRLRDRVERLAALKAHCYDFRERVIHNIPVDYLSEVTFDDFDFESYEEVE